YMLVIVMERKVEEDRAHTSQRNASSKCLRQQGRLNSPFPPPGASRGGRVPPTPLARCAPAKSAGTHRCRSSPRKRGFKTLRLNPPCASPHRHQSRVALVGASICGNRARERK